MEQIFHVIDTVFLIGIARMAADPALDEQSSITDVLEESDFGSSI